jgi:soluble lytic murein transglycosylase-like protein
MNQITKTTVIIIIIIIMANLAKADKVPYKEIIKSIEQIESSGRTHAIGKAGEIGCMQIRQIMLRHVNNLHGTTFTKKDLYSRKQSHKICYLFLKHEVSRYFRKYGEYPTLDKIISSWNSGSIMKKTRRQYTEKVLAHFYRK